MARADRSSAYPSSSLSRRALTRIYPTVPLDYTLRYTRNTRPSSMSATSTMLKRHMSTSAPSHQSLPVIVKVQHC